MDLKRGNRFATGESPVDVAMRISQVAVVGLVVFSLATPALAFVIYGKDIKNGTVTGKDIKNGSLGPGELKFDALTTDNVLLGARQFTGRMTIPSGGTDFTSVASVFPVTSRSTVRTFIINWHVGITNNTSTDSLLSFRVAVEGVVQEGTYEETIPAGTSVISSGANVTNFNPGTDRVELQIQSKGAEVSVGTRTLEAVGFGPTFE